MTAGGRAAGGRARATGTDRVPAPAQVPLAEAVAVEVHGATGRFAKVGDDGIHPWAGCVLGATKDKDARVYVRDATVRDSPWLNLYDREGLILATRLIDAAAGDGRLLQFGFEGPRAKDAAASVGALFGVSGGLGKLGAGGDLLRRAIAALYGASARGHRGYGAARRVGIRAADSRREDREWRMGLRRLSREVAQLLADEEAGREAEGKAVGAKPRGRPSERSRGILGVRPHLIPNAYTGGRN